MSENGIGNTKENHFLHVCVFGVHTLYSKSIQFSTKKLIYMELVGFAYHLNWSCLFWKETQKKKLNENMQSFSNHHYKFKAE